MKPRYLAIAALAALAALAAACTPVYPGSPTYTAGVCPTGDSGVTVVVDWTADLNNQQLVRCALGAQDSGLDALANIGLAVNTNAPGAVPGSVCTLNGLPTEGYPYCWLTGGYWSYWSAASQAGTWGFAPFGAGDGPLVEGSVIGFAWAQDFLSDGPRTGPDGNPLP